MKRPAFLIGRSLARVRGAGHNGSAFLMRPVRLDTVGYPSAEQGAALPSATAFRHERIGSWIPTSRWSGRWSPP